MIQKCLRLTALVAVLASPSVLAQSQGDVIKPPPTGPDRSVIRPPDAHADPGIEKGKPPEQSQLPEDKDKPGGGVPPPKADEKR